MEIIIQSDAEAAAAAAARVIARLLREKPNAVLGLATGSPAKEDERDLAKVKMQMPMFEALARGYLASAGGFLTKTEKQFSRFPAS